MHLAVVSVISLTFNVVVKGKVMVVKQFFFFFFFFFKTVEFGNRVRLGYNVMIGTEYIMSL